MYIKAWGVDYDCQGAFQQEHFGKCSADRLLRKLNSLLNCRLILNEFSNYGNMFCSQLHQGSVVIL